MPNLTSEIKLKLTTKLKDLEPSKKELLQRALELAEKTHQGQFRKPPKNEPELVVPYIVHPMRVALILIDELKVHDLEPICAAVLHDVVEDSDGKVTTHDIEQSFGRPVALMVSVLTKPAHDKKISREMQLKTYHDRVAQSSTPTRMVKLSDRLDNMRDALGCNDLTFQKRYLVETRHEYLPIAQATDDYLYQELVGLCDKLECEIQKSDSPE